MKNAHEAETLAFLEVLSGEYAGAGEMCSSWTSGSRDPWCDRIEAFADSGAMIVR